MKHTPQESTHTTPPVGRRFSSLRTYAMVFSVLVATALRFWHLGTWSLWEDEILTLLDARDFPAVMRINPLPYLVAKLTLTLFGETAWGARVGFALVGCLSIAVLFALVHRVYDRGTAFWTAMFTAVLPWHLFWSQNARSYALTFLFSTLAAFAFFLGLERDRWRWFVLCLGSLVALIGSHLLSGVLLLALAGYALLLRLLPTQTPRGWRWRYLLLVFGPFLLVGLAALHPRILGTILSGWGRNLWGRSPFYMLATFVYGISIPVAILSIPPVLQLVTSWRRDHLFLVCFGGVPVGFFLCASLFLNVAGYYLFFCAPAFLTLAGWTAAQCVRGNTRLGWPVPALVLGILLSQVVLYHHVEFGGRPRWQSAIQEVRQQAEPGDPVVLSIPRILDYYWPEGETIHLKQVLTNPEAALEQWRFQSVDAWFVLDAPNMSVVDASHQFRDWLYQHAQLVRRFPAYARAADRSVSVYRLPCRTQHGDPSHK